VGGGDWNENSIRRRPAKNSEKGSFGKKEKSTPEVSGVGKVHKKRNYSPASQKKAERKVPKRGQPYHIPSTQDIEETMGTRLPMLRAKGLGTQLAGNVFTSIRRVKT